MRCMPRDATDRACGWESGSLDSTVHQHCPRCGRPIATSTPAAQRPRLHDASDDLDTSLERLNEIARDRDLQGSQLDVTDLAAVAHQVTRVLGSLAVTAAMFYDRTGPVTEYDRLAGELQEARERLRVAERDDALRASQQRLESERALRAVENLRDSLRECETALTDRNNRVDELRSEVERMIPVFSHVVRWCQRPEGVLIAGREVLVNDAGMWLELRNLVAKAVP